MDNKVLLCAIAKQENLYIREWVEYHLKLGFDHITIYDNNEPDGERISDVVGSYPNVNIIDFRGRHQKSCETQVAAYNACYKGAGAYDWVMFMDIDEFLWFRDYDNIKSFLEQTWIKKANVIRFHWKCYSDNGKLKYEDLPVMERFTEECKEKSVNYHMKQLYRTKLGTLRIVNVHYTNHVNNIYYPDGKPAPYITTTKDRNVHDELAHVKHYVTKSLEEYVKIKYARRGVGSSKTRLNLDFYFKYNEKTDEKLKYYKTLINDLQNSKNIEINSKAMPYIPETKLNESKRFEPQAYYEDKFCPGAPKKQETEKNAKRNLATESKGNDDTRNTESSVRKKEDEKTVARENTGDGISVCITAYNVQDYIEECLDSVAAQTWFETHDKWEILVGIDGCEKTLAKVKEIMHKYKNLRVLMMDSNMGTYVTSNTIMKESKYELLLRFDGDDIMLPDMIDKGFNKKTKNNIVQFKFDSFGDTTLEKEQRGTPARGIIMIEKCMFEKLGGYRNWICSGDSNLYERAKILNYDIAVTDNTTFYRRIHRDSLCFNEKTRIKDKNSVRHQYIEITKNDVANNICYVEPVYNSFKEIEYEKQQEPESFVVDKIDYDDFLKCRNKIHVLIVDYKQLKYTQHLISSLLVQDRPFDLTVFEQKPDSEAKRYFDKLKESWYLEDCELNVVFNSVNAPLNHIWNWFHSHTSNKYLAFLNNDIEICNNFIGDAEQIFDNEEKCGIIIHPTNRPEYTKSEDLEYDKVTGYPVLQGWDFIINREAYSPIPGNLWIWRGDVYLMTNAYNNGWEQVYDVSSPILHYTSSTVDKHKNDIQKILDKDKLHWKNLNLKECTSRADNKYTHRAFIKTYPIDLTKKVIVSFTTWKKRITNVPGVVEQMMSQTKKPDLIILNLSYEEFKWHKILLRDVFQLERNNPIFKINMVEGENTKVWKKWLPIIDKYDNDLIIPIDDDIVYPNDFIERLYNKWLENPYNPITGDLVFLGGFLQAHCGAGSLIFRQAFGIYMNDYKKIIEDLYASDVFYSFAAYMNGYDYIKEGMNVLKFGRHDEIAPYSHAKNKTIPKQPQLMDMDFLTNYYLDNEYIIAK